MSDVVPRSEVPDEELLDWMVRYHDGQLDEFEMVALMAMLEGDDRALSLFHETSLHALTIAEHWAVAPSAKPMATKWRGGWNSGLVVVAACLAVIASIAWWPASPRQVVKVADLTGSVMLVQKDGSQRSLRPGDVLFADEHIVTHELGGFATLIFEDGTSIQLFQRTEVCCRQELTKQIEVFQGNVVADVAPQPEGRPLRIITADSITEVLGTVLAIQVSSQQTDVDVLEGKVRVARLGDQSMVDVAAGEKTTVSRKVPLTTRPRTTVGETWKCGFEYGLPREWIKGIWTRESLPPGSRGALRAEMRPGFWDANIAWYEVESYNRWSRGLCTVVDDSRLRMSFFTENADWVQIVLLTRDPNFKQADATYEYIVRKYGKRGEPGWHEVDIPLSAFRRTVSDPNIGYAQSPLNPPPSGIVVFKVIVSTQDRDMGLVVDWIEIAARPEKRSAIDSR